MTPAFAAVRSGESHGSFAIIACSSAKEKLKSCTSSPRDQEVIAVDSGQHIQASITGSGFSCHPTIDSSEWNVAINLHVLKRGTAQRSPITDPAIWHEPGRSIAAHGSFDIEHVISTAGIRQNFIVHERMNGSGTMDLLLTISSGLRPLDLGQNVIAFADEQFTQVLRYSELCVWDAKGDTLQANMALRGDTIVIRVDDATALYPVTVDPLLTTATWTMVGDQSNSEFGWSVSSAGDVNGDGYSDIIIGHHLYDNGQTNEGRVLVYHGTASGPSTTPNWTFEPNVASAQLGYSVSTAGDVNGDGYSDVIVGAPYLDNGQTDEGRVYVFHGSATGLSTTPNWTYERDQAAAYLGRSVACAGDVNGDGFSDIIFGAPYFDGGNTNEGRVFVFHGSATGLGTSTSWITESDQDGANAGASVASAGDVNGDGFSDIIYGAPLYNNGQTDEGRAVVHLGSATGLSATAHWTTESGQAYANAGSSVASAGDVNNDGYSDVVIGTPLWDNGSTDEGRVQIARGGTTGLTIIHQSYESNATNHQRGTSVGCAGDVNGDGFSDVIVGSPLSSNGLALILSGSAAGISGSFQTLNGPQVNARYGRSVSSAGDVNGDGFSDVLVGAYLHDNPFTNEGRAYCHLGAPASINAAPDHTLVGPNTFGRSVSSAGDVNGDGYGDVVIGAPDSRHVAVHHGSATGTSFIPDRTYTMPTIPGFGNCVGHAGDVNGDGYSDVIVGTVQGNTVYVYHGSATGLPVAANWTATGTAGTRFGFSVSSAGDVNGDGYADVIIGQPDHNSGAGRVVVHHGSPTGLSVAPSWVSTPFDAPHMPNSNYGEGVDGAGDVNGDGYSDVIIGAGGYNGSRGRVMIFHGGPTGLGATPATVFDHPVAGQRMGSHSHSGATVGGIGDVNGDGYGDVMMAPMGFQTRTYHGGPGGVSTLAAWTSANFGGGFYAATVASAGDLNADGYSDVIVSNCNLGGMVYFGGQWGLGGPIFGSPTNTHDLLRGGSGLHSACAAGDVNGDGYGDVILGRYPTNEAFVYYGNSSTDLARGQLRLYETDLMTPITSANLPIPQFGAGLFVRPFLGRARTRLVWETRIQGQAFSTGSNGLVNNSTAFTAQQPAFMAGSVAGVELKSLIDKPGGGTGITANKVRVRVRYDPATAITGQVFGPWRYMPGYLEGHGTHNNVPLPVELLRFDGVCVNGAVELSWATASEENSSHFVVQRSLDAEQWSDVTRQTAAGHSHALVEYDYRDNVPPHATVLYYRLLQVDLDGVTTVLPTTTSHACRTNTVAVFPNPTEAWVRIVPGASSGALARVDVMDGNGRTVLVESAISSEGGVDLNLGPLPAGAYLLRLCTAQGTVLSTEHVVKR